MVHEGEETRDRKEVESSNTPTMEHNKHRNAWVPSQGHKEGGQCMSVCAGMPSQVLGQREGSSYMEFNGLNLRLPLHSFFKTLGIWGIFFFIFLSLES